MKDIETVTLELSPYEAAILRHAMTEALHAWRFEKSKRTVSNIDKALKSAGVRLLYFAEVKKGKILFI